MRHAMFKHVICKISECICFHFVDMLVKPLAYLHKTVFADIFCKKMVIVGERMKLRRDDFGIVMTGIYEFLFDPKILDA